MAVSATNSECETCRARLFFAFGAWWDDNGWRGDARNGQPWHLHEPDGKQGHEDHP